MNTNHYFAASDDHTDHYRRVGSGALERRESSMDSSFMSWYPVPAGYLESWGIELIPLPCTNDSGLRILS